MRYKASFDMNRPSHKGKQIKLPGYWPRSFTKICVTMDFPANFSRNATSILMNYTAQSLYSVLHDGAERTSPVDFSTVKTPPDIDKSCLAQGFNLPVNVTTRPLIIKSRVAVKSRDLNSSPLSYFVRGVGISYPGVSCGEIIIINNPYLTVKSYPAFCKIFVQ